MLINYNTYSQKSKPPLRLSIAGGQHFFKSNSDIYGKVYCSESVFGEIIVSGVRKFCSTNIIFGVGCKAQGTQNNYIKYKNSPQSIYHSASKISFFNMYVKVPLGAEFILNTPMDDLPDFYILPQVNFNGIFFNKRKFIFTNVERFSQKAKEAAETFKNTNFKSYTDFSIEAGVRIKQKQIIYSGGIRVGSGNKNIYSTYGGIKPFVISISCHMQIKCKKNI